MEVLFPGLRAMQNIHPVFVHFPLVLLPLALVLQAFVVWRKREDWQRAALWALWLGSVAALAAAGTGLLAEEEVQVPDPAIEVIELHETLMLSATGMAGVLSVIGLVVRRHLTRPVQTLLLVGLLLMSAVLVVGADRGGQLVYQYGVGVQKAATQP